MAEAVASDAAEASVTSDAHLRLKEPPKLRTTDFGEGHTDWKHQTLNSVQFWNNDVAELMTKKELSFTKWNDDEEDEFWINPKLMSASEAGFRLLSTHLCNVGAPLGIYGAGSAVAVDSQRIVESHNAGTAGLICINTSSFSVILRANC